MGPHELGGRLELAARSLRAEFRVGRVPLVAVGITEMHAGFRGAVQLVIGRFVAEVVAPVVGEPEVRVDGCQSNPTVFRIPRAKISRPLPSGFMRMMEA